MARTLEKRPNLATYYRTATGPRTRPLTVAWPRLEWSVQLGSAQAESRDSTSVILIPETRSFTHSEEDDEEDAEWRHDLAAFDCFKTSFAYNLINQEHPEHPRLVP